MLFRRRKSSGRGAAIICLIVSIGLHVAILVWVPRLSLFFSGGGRVAETGDAAGESPVSVAVFDPSFVEEDFSDADSLSDQLSRGDESESDDTATLITPLSLGQPIAELQVPTTAPTTAASDDASPPEPAADALVEAFPKKVPASLASTSKASPKTSPSDVEDLLGDWLDETLAVPEVQPDPAPEQVASTDSAVPPATAPPRETVAASAETRAPSHAERADDSPNAAAPKTHVPGQVDEDFAARQGAAKYEALNATGGDANTEACVAAALKFLAEQQRPDGAWDPLASGAGRERAPLGLQRGSAGKRAETGLTGLALLSLLGAGNTHQSGEYRDNVYRGLVYLLGRQRSDGSLAGDASIYAAHYCHAMASLALAEASAMTGDPAAIEATRRAVAYSRSTQHPVTGGWRYTRGDAGDLSQLGWQAMLLDGARRAGVFRSRHELENDQRMQDGVARFLASVRSGRAGGLASYRPGERATPTMTAEALATRLLIGEKVPPDTIREAEAVLLSALPGRTAGPDNLYYWYYATLALHQLQDDAWETWNDTMKQRLLATQLPSGSWPDSTLWGGYGGTVYTTAMATLCLETYYRHQLRR
ncbi:prenyltransferase/squalene oxidase repeat-containing protein [Aporhodopirellula aestuarii]|uniref:Squalene--hopene cyclase n=1 Tax=Aporhodopirellula aestuarii TaxID=2950107 RepID=A0ABT0UBI3_9BACT|nr:prenyltransferase/squalene oxidase repeat-containing protein [Aporhodopirellula aestuarii]MCM2374353.1 squalene--hopene cyclase [Aporhodopirellula aestuarii]